MNGIEKAAVLEHEPQNDRLWTLGEVKQLTSWDTKTLNKRIYGLDIEVFKVSHDKRFKFIKEEDIRWLIAVFLNSTVWDWAWPGFWEGTKRRRYGEDDIWEQNPDLLHLSLSKLASMERSRMYYKKSAVEKESVGTS